LPPHFRSCPAGRAHCAWSGHFMTDIPALSGPPYGRDRSCLRPSGAPSEGVYASRSDRRPRRAPSLSLKEKNLKNSCAFSLPEKDAANSPR
jgi:hypothetical protein